MHVTSDGHAWRIDRDTSTNAELKLYLSTICTDHVMSQSYERHDVTQSGSVTMAQKQISIIGAGLGGLTLAQHLRSHNIRARIYDQSSGARHKYGINLLPHVYEALARVLGIDVDTLQTRTAVDAEIGGRGKIQVQKCMRCTDATYMYRANRHRLESLLQQGLDINWKHKLVDVTLPGPATSDATQLHFDNGQSCESDLVIGFDGVHSTIRENIFAASSQVDVLPYVVVRGQRKLGSDEFETASHAAFRESNVVESYLPNGTCLHVAVDDIDADQVTLTWMYSRPARGDRDSLFNPNRPKTAASNVPEAFFDEIKQLTDLEPVFAKVFDMETMLQDRKLTFLMRTTSVERDALIDAARAGVVLVGDAAHAEPIRGGYGANNAIDDAIGLAEQIAKTSSGAGLASWVAEQKISWEKGCASARGSLEQLHRPG